MLTDDSHLDVRLLQAQIMDLRQDVMDLKMVLKENTAEHKETLKELKLNQQEFARFMYTMKGGRVWFMILLAAISTGTAILSMLGTLWVKGH